jgi:hypothetical protein
MFKIQVNAGSNDSDIDQLITDLKMSFHLPDEKKKAIIKGELEELLKENGVPGVIAGKMAIMQHYQNHVDNYRIKSELLPEGKYLPDEEMNIVRDIQGEIFKLGSEICALDGSIPPLSPDDPLVVDAKELSQDLSFFEVVNLTRSVSGSFDGCFGEHTYRPSHQITLKGFDEDGTVTLTRDDIKSLLWFFDVNKLL